MKLRGKLIHDEKRMTFPPFEMMAAALRKEGNIWAGYRENRADWFPEDLKAHGLPEQAEMAYFAGCTASYVEHDIGRPRPPAAQAGVDFTYLGEQENCCGIPMLVAGKWDTWEDNMRQNIDAMKAAGVEDGDDLVPGLLTWCGDTSTRTGPRSSASTTVSRPGTTARSWPSRSRPASSSFPNTQVSR